MQANILQTSFYAHEDVLAISQALLGKFIVTEYQQKRTVGMIVETEAYNGALDRASHAFNDRRTSRTQTLYQAGGVAYVYLCYGMHNLFNIVTGALDNPQAVLIRAIEPVEGIEVMLERRKLLKPLYRLTNGPGVLTQALGISIEDNSRSLYGSPLWIEDRGLHFTDKQILKTPRVGIDYAKEHRDLPWRFRVKGNPWIGK